MRYDISLKSPLSHLINIEVGCKTTQKSVIFYLPIWRPGRYEAAHYAKNIQKIEFRGDDGSVLNYRKLNHSSWEVHNPNQQKILVSYTYYAHQMDAGNSWYSDEQLYLNFINCLLYVKDQLDEPCLVKLNIPDTWKIACALDHIDGTLKASNYYHLVDCPMIASPTISEVAYKSYGVPFKIWWQGRSNLNKDQLVRDFKKFSDCQIALFNEFPDNQYYFLNQFVPYKFYHGVEHGSSTVICIGPASELNSEELYNELIGVSSHELFHAWNIIKIRPKELMPYKFDEPANFSTGFVAEGFTTYYGDLMLKRSGVRPLKWYLTELSKLLTRHFHNYGRFHNSVINSSIDLWVDGYQASAPHKKSSIYVEGALIALCLDLKIRLKHHQTKSLDDVMRILWSDYGKTGIGYSDQDIVKVCERVFDASLADFFTEHVYGTANKWELLQELFLEFGLYLMREPNAKSFEGLTGAKVLASGGKFIIAAIEPESIAEEHLSLRDEVIHINGEPLTDELIKTVRSISSLTIIRNGEDLGIQLAANDNRYWQPIRVMLTPEPTNLQASNLESWLDDHLMDAND